MGLIRTMLERLILPLQVIWIFTIGSIALALLFAALLGFFWFIGVAF